MTLNRAARPAQLQLQRSLWRGQPPCPWSLLALLKHPPRRISSPCELIGELAICHCVYLDCPELSAGFLLSIHWRSLLDCPPLPVVPASCAHTVVSDFLCFRQVLLCYSRLCCRAGSLTDVVEGRAGEYWDRLLFVLLGTSSSPARPGHLTYRFRSVSHTPTL